jgi:hypothetical protein
MSAPLNTFLTILGACNFLGGADIPVCGGRVKPRATSLLPVAGVASEKRDTPWGPALLLGSLLPSFHGEAGYGLHFFATVLSSPRTRHTFVLGS